MSIQGTFVADFASFYEAASKAEVSLTGVETRSGSVTTALNRVSNSLSGTRLVQDAALAAEAVNRIGGVSMLTEAELARLGATASQAVEKLTAMGQDVPPGIQAIADAAEGASGSLQKFLGDFSLTDAINAPLATAKDGVIALAGEIGIADLVGGAWLAGIGAVSVGLFSLGGAAEATGEEIAKMSMVSGVAVGPMSDMKFAFEAAGGSAEQLNTVMFMLEQRMQTSPEKVAAGLSLIGLSLDDLEKLKGDQQILAISDAMRAAGDDTNKAAASFDILGRQGREALPLLMQPLSDLVQTSKDVGNTWSVEDVAAARAFAEAARLSAETTKAAWKDVGLAVAPATDELSAAWDRAKLAMANVAVAAVQLGGVLPLVEGWLGKNALAAETDEAKTDTLIKAYQLGAPAAITYAEAVAYVNSAYNLGAGVAAEFSAKQQVAIDKMIAGMKGEGDQSRELVAAITSTIAAGDLDVAGKERVITEIEKLIKAHQTLSPVMQQFLTDNQTLTPEYAKAEAALKSYNVALADLESVGTTWGTTLDQLDGTVVEAIKYYLEAGVSQSTLAKVYAVTAAQVGALAGVLKEETDATKAATAEADKLAKAQDALNQKISEDSVKGWAEYAAIVETASGSAYDKATANIDKWLADEIASHVKAGTDTADFYARVTAEDNAKYAALKDNLSLYDKDTRSYAQAELDIAQKKYAQMIAGGDEWSAKSIAQQAAVVNNLQTTIATWGQLDEAVNGVTAAITGATAATLGLAQASASLDTGAAAASAMNSPLMGGAQTNLDYATAAGQNAPQIGLAEFMQAWGTSNPYSLQYWQAYLLADDAARAKGRAILHQQGVPGFAEGGTVMVGENGPEAVRLPFGSTVFPSGSSAGPTINVAINVSGVFDPATSRKLAQTVSEQIMQTAKLNRQFGSA